MSLSRLIARWQGAVLSLIGIVATVWLGMTGQLGLYIHPRYFAFAIVMAVCAAAVVIVSFALSPEDDHAEHDHENTPGPKRLWSSASVVIIAASAAALLILPPTTLTTSTLAQRDLNGSAASLSEEASVELAGGDASKFSVKDWASLLLQGAGPEFYAGKTAQLTGFVTPDKDDPENVFYVARFVVSHCVVDAQPVGVPVYRPGWQEDFALDSWVGVTGGLAENPSVTSTEGIVIIPEAVTAVEQPQEPYVY